MSAAVVLAGMATDHLLAALALGVLSLLARASVAGCVSQPPPDMAWVAGGGAMMARDDAVSMDVAAKPPAVREFWLGRHEVSNREFARFVAATAYLTTAELEAPDHEVLGSFVFRHLQRLKLDSSWWRLDRTANWRHPQGKNSDWTRIPDHPVVHVTLADALAYAHWAGGMLPTDMQWEHAAKLGRQKSDALAANTWQGEFPMHDTAADGHAGTAPVGSYAPDALGLYDMLGNVWELTRSVDMAGRQAVIKGGSFLCNARYCNGARPEAKQWQDTQTSAAHVGFRLAAVPCR